MTDYTPLYVTEYDVRSFFTPALTYSDVSKQELLTKIEAVETYVRLAWQVTSAADAKIPCLLLVASKLVFNPKISKTYNSIVMEKLGDYQYKLGDVTSTGSASANPWAIAKTWEQMAIDILNSRSTKRQTIYVVNS